MGIKIKNLFIKKFEQMKAIILGMGVQGEKRRIVCGSDFAGFVDPAKSEAAFKSITDVPLDSYDVALCCTPDGPKEDIIRYLVRHKKHVLLEKPFFVKTTAVLDEIQSEANRNSIFVYTAYNHRFEPNFIAMKELLDKESLGEIYHCRIFYGNGTAQLVKDSVWRDTSSGVLHDLGSHLLDTIRFWFGARDFQFRSSLIRRHENRAPDHVSLMGSSGDLTIDLDMMLLSWRNHFTCDVFGSKGSAHLSSLCKWGPSSITVRNRIFPSGRPDEKKTQWLKSDPTWALEYKHFKEKIKKKAVTDLSSDRWISHSLETLSLDNTP